MRGSIVKRTLKDGRKAAYYCVVEEVTPDGKRRRRWHSDPVTKAGFTDKANAQTYLAKLLVGLDAGTYAVPDNCTLDQWLDHWLSTKTRLKASTLSGYKKKLDTHVRPRIGSMRLQRIDYDVCVRLLADLDTGGRADHRKGEPLSAATVRQVSTILSSALTAAADSGRIAVNPMPKVARARKGSGAKAAKRPVKAWTPQEVGRFLTATADDSTFAPLWRFLIATGVRRGEALGLRWVDLDLDARTATIEHTRLKVDGKVIVDTPKTAAGHRSIPLDAVTVAAMKVHRAKQAEQRLMLGLGKPSTDDYVFCDPTGVPLHPERVSKVFAQQVRALDGLTPLTPHGLRHTWASSALRAGVSPKVVQERLGHAHVSVTLGVYSHLLGDDMQVQAADLVAGLFDAAIADGR